MTNISVFMSMLYCFYDYSSIVQFEIGDDDTPNISFVRSVLVILAFYLFICLFLYEAKKCPFKICEELFQNLDRDCIESVDYF